jgi:4-amino-4-deoxy-L-arabinose transferase-like glycosyltransferase
MPLVFSDQRRRDVIWLAGAALLARLLCLLLIDFSADPAVGDAGAYLDFARNMQARIGEGGLAWFSFRAPTYTPLLVATFAIWDSHAAVYVVQALLTFAATLVAYTALRRYHPRLAFVAAALIVTSPFLILFELQLLTEILYISLFSAGFFLLFDAAERNAWRGVVLAGVLLGLAILSRETLVLFPPFLFAAALLLKADRSRLRAYGLAWAVAWLTVLPVPLLQASVTGQFSYGRGTGGQLLWTGTWERDSRWHEEGYPDYAFRNEAERTLVDAARRENDDRALLGLALDRIADDPLGVATTWVIRHPRMWLGTRSDLNPLVFSRGSFGWTVTKAGLYGFNALVLLFGAAGACLCLRQRSRLVFFLAPVVYTAATYLPFHNAETRYSLQAYPAIYVFAAVALCSLGRRLQARSALARKPAIE